MFRTTVKCCLRERKRKIKREREKCQLIQKNCREKTSSQITK